MAPHDAAFYKALVNLACTPNLHPEPAPHRIQAGARLPELGAVQRQGPSDGQSCLSAPRLG